MTEPVAGEVTLAAVMFLDIVGYSALMQAGEARALAAVREFEQILGRLVPASGGRLVKFLGDGSMASFPSAEAAVSCGMEIQEAVAARNSGAGKRDRFLLRIGIHLGEVVEKEGDLFGDAVNIAARIQPLSDPGGMALSPAVISEVSGMVRVPGTMRRRVRLKNIAERTNIFLAAPVGAWFPSWYAGKHRSLVALGVVAVLGGILGGIWRFISTPVAVSFESFKDLGEFWSYSIGDCPGKIELARDGNLSLMKVRIPCDSGVWAVGTDCNRLAGGNWSEFTGIRFRIRGTVSKPVSADLYEKREDGREGGGEIWRAEVPVREEWTRVDLPFASFRKRANFQPPGQDRNEVFNIERVSSLNLEAGLGKGIYEISGIWLLKPRFPALAKLARRGPPRAPGQPSGPTEAPALSLSRYHIQASPRSGLVVKLDWGDGSVSQAAADAQAGTVALSHSWNGPGTYAVKAQAVDPVSGPSPWSPALVVRVGGSGPVVFDDAQDSRLWEAYSNKVVTVSRTETAEGAALVVAAEDTGESGYWLTLKRTALLEGAWMGFRGVSLRFRSDPPVPIYFGLEEQSVLGNTEGEAWQHDLDAGPEWTTVEVPFTVLKKIGLQPAGQDGNGRLDLESLEMIRIGSRGYAPGANRFYLGPVRLLWKEDSVPPSVTSAGITSRETGDAVLAVFSEHLDPATAGNAANYRIFPGVPVLSASLWEDGLTVELFVEGSWEWGTGHRLLVGGVKDLVGNAAAGLEVPILPAGDGLTARYFPSVDFSGEFVERTDPRVFFSSGEEAVCPGIPLMRMSVRWTGWLKVAEGGEYTFVMRSDDGGRLLIDGKAILDDWKTGGDFRIVGRTRFQEGSWHRITAETYNGGGNAAMDLRWSHAGLPPAIISPLNLFTKKPAAEKPVAKKPGK